MIIKSLELYTNKINVLKEFYSGIIGLKILNENANCFTMNCGSSDITFIAAPENTEPFYHFAFNIPENKLSEAKEKLSRKLKLIRLNGEDEFCFSSWNAHSVYFHDPSGNIAELIARHNLSNGSAEDFSGKSILAVSEFGLPVYNVEKSYDEINNEFNIPVFSGDRKEFCAAGNDSGLFIIVNKGRKWFPGCADAEIFPAVINIISDKAKEILLDNLPYKIISHPS